MGSSARALLAVALFTACANHHRGNGIDAAQDGSYVADSCVGLACFQFDCASKTDPMTGLPLPPTSISGTVYAPNGTLPLYGVNVYVPATDPGPLADGVQCDQCSAGLQGGSLAQTKTDEAGHFKLDNVPATADVPIVIQVGKWRRQIKLANVAACADLPIAQVETTLPKSMTDLTPNTTGVDMPYIAISTGAADALECLIRKLGIADKEISTAGGAGKIHLYADPGAGFGQGANTFAAGFAGGTGGFADSATLWSDVNKMKAYDILLFSCEGSQYPATKPQASMDAVKAYADLGGRVFMSHWHNIWIEGAGAGLQAPAVWTGVASWNNSGTSFNSPPVGTSSPDLIDEVNNPKGASFATWMDNVMGSPMHDVIPITQGKQTCTAVDNTKAERWVYWPNATVEYPQDFQFTTPNEVPADQRCGKVVFSDMHVASGSTSTPTVAYPGGCATAPLTSQEKALAFMFFDISSCVGSIF